MLTHVTSNQKFDDIFFFVRKGHKLQVCMEFICGFTVFDLYKTMGKFSEQILRMLFFESVFSLCPFMTIHKKTFWLCLLHIFSFIHFTITKCSSIFTQPSNYTQRHKKQKHIY